MKLITQLACLDMTLSILTKFQFCCCGFLSLANLRYSTPKSNFFKEVGWGDSDVLAEDGLPNSAHMKKMYTCFWGISASR